jgi:hypothetical protein
MEDAMLKEFEKVRQREGEGFRRFFSDGYFELMVWYDEGGKAITGFQLAYDVKSRERVLTYKADEGRVMRSHHYNTGNAFELHGSAWSSVLAGDAGRLDERVLDRFLIAARHIEPEILEYVKNYLKDFC